MNMQLNVQIKVQFQCNEKNLYLFYYKSMFCFIVLCSETEISINLLKLCNLVYEKPWQIYCIN